MAGNVNTAPREFLRQATRFTRLFLRPRVVKQDTQGGDTGVYAGTQLAVLQLPQGQTANALEVQDSTGGVGATGKVLFAVDANGNYSQGGVPGTKQCVAQIALTAAQILTLNTVPVALVAAPGANLAIVVDAMTFQFKYNSIAFTGGGPVNPVFHGATTNLMSGQVAAGTIQAAANACISLGAAANALTLTPNTGVDLYAGTGNFAAGNSTAIVTIWYSIVNQG